LINIEVFFFFLVAFHAWIWATGLGFKHWNGIHITVSELRIVAIWIVWSRGRAHTIILKEKEPTKARERWEVPCIDLGVSWRGFSSIEIIIEGSDSWCWWREKITKEQVKRDYRIAKLRSPSTDLGGREESFSIEIIMSIVAYFLSHLL
jgi:hypothetical protein